MELALIKVYDYDYDFEYEQFFLVKNDKDKIEELNNIVEDARKLDLEDRYKKYGAESLIDIAEQYIIDKMNNQQFNKVDINCYY